MASLTDHIRHWFTPHHTNNYRARILHNSSILVIIGVIIGTNALIRIVESSPLHILGFNSSVTIDEVVSATNRERLAAGLPALSYSDTLADAARRKAANMFEENYWAHNAPSGKNPWVWFTQAGYKYLYAGENLAKDFGSTDRMINAWMNSPTHKANIVNGKYKEIGVAVVPGVLTGSETVLVVQLFGTPAVGSGGSVPSVSEVSPRTTTENVKGSEDTLKQVPKEIEVMEVKELGAPVEETKTISPRIDQYLVKKYVATATAVLFLLALVADLIISESSRLSRRVGKNWGHILVINVMLLLVTIAHAGSIR